MNDIIPQDDTPRKQCNKCLEWFPATLAYFHKGSRWNKMGLVPQCKKCKGKGTNFGIIREPKEHRDNEKWCPRCEQWLPKDSEHFGVDNRRKDKLNIICKECLLKDRGKRKDKIDTQQKAYQINNHERVLERDRTRHKRDKEKRNAQSRQSYQRHKGERQAYSRQWNVDNTEERSSYAHQYRIDNLEQRRAYGRRHYAKNKEQYFANVRNRKSRQKQVAGNHTSEQVQEQLKRQHYRCYYARCGFAKLIPDKRFAYGYRCHVEHTYPISRVVGTDIPANDMGYIVISCPDCNMAKGDRFPWEWPEGGRLL